VALVAAMELAGLLLEGAVLVQVLVLALKTQLHQEVAVLLEQRLALQAYQGQAHRRLLFYQLQEEA
jgi:hypothetical protein